MTGHSDTPPAVAPERGAADPRRRIREFLAAYRHPNAINGQDWTEADIERLATVAACPHQPGPRDRRLGGRRCTLCAACMEES
jgi:hypothetical protein